MDNRWFSLKCVLKYSIWVNVPLHPTTRCGKVYQDNIFSHTGNCLWTLSCSKQSPSSKTPFEMLLDYMFTDLLSIHGDFQALMYFKGIMYGARVEPDLVPAFIAALWRQVSWSLLYQGEKCRWQAGERWRLSSPRCVSSASLSLTVRHVQYWTVMIHLLSCYFPVFSYPGGVSYPPYLRMTSR